MEYKKTGYVARDKNGKLYIYDKLPKRKRQFACWFTNNPYDKFYELPKDWFPEITWLSKPVMVEITINS